MIRVTEIATRTSFFYMDKTNIYIVSDSRSTKGSRNIFVIMRPQAYSGTIKSE